jgi:lipoprotein-anchoring transpeptidase ErfK/SrfK
MFRVGLATLATLTAALATTHTTPVAAQWFSDWERDGRRPFWEQQDRRSGWGEDKPRYERQPVVRGGGGRPDIAPEAPVKVGFNSNFAPDTIVIDSAARKLYYVLSPSEAYQYPISVGREGFSWTGTEMISRKQEWPDWHPPKEMIARDPRLPSKMTGGVRNPLGALALYLGNTLYRIHGTNDPSTIGQAASSGCFRMMNGHVLHLASIADVGTPVTVVKRLPETLTMSLPEPSPKRASKL